MSPLRRASERLRVALQWLDAHGVAEALSVYAPLYREDAAVCLHLDYADWERLVGEAPVVTRQGAGGEHVSHSLVVLGDVGLVRVELVAIRHAAQGEREAVVA